MEPNESAPRLVRLNKLLADNGIASRRRADKMIAEGEIMVDGHIVTELGTKVDPTTQRVEWDGVIMKASGDLHRYYLLNKPTGVVCTNDEKELRRRAWDMITDPAKGRVYPVGRLDVDSSGLIILTNDGEFTHKVTHPSFGIEKTYEVKIESSVDDHDLDRIRRGLHLSDGKTGGARILVMSRNDHASRISITLTEGKNREVRRVFARYGYKVKELHRVSIGPLRDKGLGMGHWRQLGPEEVAAILAAGSTERTKRPQRPQSKKRYAKPEETDARPRSDSGPRSDSRPGSDSRPRSNSRSRSDSNSRSRSDSNSRSRSDSNSRPRSNDNNKKSSPWGR